jgi:TolB-like protein/lipopolysaccharide biosynthesis regulator YciM
VLPFKPLVVENRDQSLEMGMADTLIMKLGRISNIIVRPIGTVRKYASLDQDPLAAGREQRVDAVLDGSIQRSGEQIRVTAQLVRVADGALLWADKFDVEFTDIFNVQDAIAEQIARTLIVKLTAEQQSQLTRRHTENAEAYKAYMVGRYWWDKRNQEGINKAIEYFNQAIAIDPSYGLAHTGLANCYVALSGYGILPPDEAFPRAKAAIMKALEMDDQSVEARTSLAHITCLYDRDWSGAEGEFKRAIGHNPNYPTAHQWYAFLLSSMARHEEAIAEAKIALELDPLSIPAHLDVTRAFYNARQYDQAIEAYERILEIDPSYIRPNTFLDQAYEQKRLYDKVVEIRAKAMAEYARAPESAAALKKAYALKGWRGYCQKEVEMIERHLKTRYVQPYFVARVYARAGQKDKTIEWLEEGSDHLVSLKVDPMLDGLREDPRFQDLLRRVGFTQ